MSNEELAQAYSEGRVSRRIFIRTLMATGVTAGAAVAYAQFLSPTAYGKAPSSSGSGTTGGFGGDGNGIYGGGGGSPSTAGGGGTGRNGRAGGVPGS